MAKLRCIDGYDSKIRICVYYSSSGTSGKEILLTSTTFSEKELLRASVSAGVLISDMISEYCTGAKAYVEVVPPFPPCFNSLGCAVLAAPNEANPLTQHYIFYHESDNISPYLDVKESTFEPKFTGHVPAIFFKNLLSSLENSSLAWQKRLELERMRQGYFTSVEEAHLVGWHSVTILVKGARIATKSPQQRASESVANNTNGVLPSTNSSGSLSAATVAAAQTAVTAAPSNSNLTGHNLAVNIPHHVIHIFASGEKNPVGRAHSYDGASQQSKSNQTRISSPVGSNSISISVPSVPSSSSSSQPRLRNQSWLSSTGKRVDDSGPNSFVNISIEDR